jgi:hypothetical protein
MFANGRMEEFLTAKTLQPEEMGDPRFVPHIARLMRRLHDTVPTDGTPTLWPTIWRWFELARQLSFEDDTSKQAKFDQIDFEAMRLEVRTRDSLPFSSHDGHEDRFGLCHFSCHQAGTPTHAHMVALLSPPLPFPPSPPFPAD